MAFDHSHGSGQRVAIVGGGISGLASAWLLSDQHRVTLFEASPRLGGHARTVLAGRRGDQWVDTGFIVFNYVTYPHLTRLFNELDVPVERSDMSFALSVDGGRFEYALRTLNSVFGQRRNLADPRFHAMIRDLLRFNASAETLADDPDLTLGDLAKKLDLGDRFKEFYLRPMCGAIWSTPPERVFEFPARALIQFFRNHGLLGLTGQHQWWTVSGGSLSYVQRLEAALRTRGVEIRSGCPVGAVTRADDGVELFSATHEPQVFDQVVFACHADEALRLIANPTDAETQTLGAIRFQDNHAVLHRDPRQMPRRRRCWASWCVQSGGRPADNPVGVTYWMNKLQNIPEDDPLFVTLNAAETIPDNLVYDEARFRHPVFDLAALEAQSALGSLQGQNRSWFAGAWMRNGFHEDGFASALRISKRLAPAVV
ncbi:MAG: FAD-dependent oxidoreductase [Pseudomonadota bacterium]